MCRRPCLYVKLSFLCLGACFGLEQKASSLGEVSFGGLVGSPEMLSTAEA